MDARRAVVQRAGDVHGGETAAENGDRTLIAEAGPQATEGVGLDDVVKFPGAGETTLRGRQPRYQPAVVRRYRPRPSGHRFGALLTWRASDKSRADPELAETADGFRQGRRQVVAVHRSRHRHRVEVRPSSDSSSQLRNE